MMRKTNKQTKNIPKVLLGNIVKLERISAYGRSNKTRPRGSAKYENILEKKKRRFRLRRA